MGSAKSTRDSFAKLSFAKVYPMYLQKVEKKGRTSDELHEVISWLTGFDNGSIENMVSKDVNFEEFFEKASLNPNAHLIRGVICGYRVEDIDDELTRQVRYLDKLVDELAKGKKMENILRS